MRKVAAALLALVVCTTAVAGEPLSAARVAAAFKTGDIESFKALLVGPAVMIDELNGGNVGAVSIGDLIGRLNGCSVQFVFEHDQYHKTAGVVWICRSQKIANSTDPCRVVSYGSELTPRGDRFGIALYRESSYDAATCGPPAPPFIPRKAN